MSNEFNLVFDRLHDAALSEAGAIELLASMRQQLQRTAAATSPRPLLVTPQWQPHPFDAPVLGAGWGAFDVVVLVCGDPQRSAQWADGLTSAGPAPRVISLRASHELLAKLAHAEHPADALAEGAGAFLALEAIPAGANVAVLLMDDLDTASAPASAPEGAAHVLYLGKLLWTFALMQRLLDGPPLGRCHVLNLASLGHALPLTAALQGLLKTLVLESPRMACGTLWLPDSSTTRAAIHTVAEELADFEPGHHREVAWFDGRRCTRVLAEKPIVERPARPALFGPDDCVLITGGAGGLGRLLAERLIAQFGTRVLLCGRRPQDGLEAEERHWLDAHSNVRYLRVDVSDPAQVRDLMADCHQRYGKLAAIFHAAGAVDDGPLRSKNLGSARAVLAPKVLGSYWLDAYSAEWDIGYFVCFSSIASLAGSPGQADYASANGFMDEFCRIRQSAAESGRQYISINWPYWLEGGMRADARHLSRMTAQSGLEGLEASAGWESLLAILAHPEPQVVVLPGEVEKLRHAFLGRGHVAAPEKADEAPGDDAGGQVEQVLRGLIAQTLKMDESSISDDEHFNNYGFDSILLTELASAIRARYPEITLEVGVFLDHPTLRELADWMLARVAPGGAREARDEPSGVRHVTADDDVLLAKLRELTSQILKLPSEDIDQHTPWTDFGFDSISLNEFAASIGRTFPSIPIANDLFLSCSTLAELVDVLAKHAPVADTATPEPIRPIAPAAMPEPIRPIAPAAMADTLEIAIIGVAGRFPAAEDLSEFWRNLVEDRGAVTTIPADRWRWQDYDGDPSQEPGKTDCHFASFLTGIDAFDAAHFNISPREAELMDPQQRLLLESAWEAFENAAVDPGSLQGRKVGIFFGAEKNDYLTQIAEAEVDIDPYINTGNAHAMIANRVSYFFGLTGPSVTLNTACSSSFSAIHAAVSSLRHGECEMALAGGVNILLSPGLFVLNRKMGMLTSQDHIKPFDKDASGHLFGEGLGLVLLKPLQRAAQDGDPIQGVIQAIEVSHGGHGRFLTTPHAPAHEALIRRVLGQARMSMDDVDYLEAQGSGDQITDRMELETYHALLQGASRTAPLPIGSIKGHIGHLGAASGVTALIKALLSLHHDCLLPIRHHRQLNWQGAAPFAGRLLTEKTAWPPKTRHGEPVPRTVGLHNFGYGGVNGHMLVREYLAERASQARSGQPHRPDGGPPAGGRSGAARLWVFSARTAEQLERTVARFCNYVAQAGYRLYGQPCPSVEQVAYTLQVGRQAMKHRLAIAVDEDWSDTQALSEPGPVLSRLRAWLDRGQLGSGMWQASAPASSASKRITKNGDVAPDALASLADSWVRGASIDWASCYGDAPPPRWSLPSYPFSPTRHWVAKPARTFSVRPKRLHPLVHSNVGTESKIAFSSTFHGDESFFRDHRIQGSKTLPGAAYCEMLLAAAALARPESARETIDYRLENIVWTRPLAIADQSIHVSLVMDEENAAFRFSIQSAGDGPGEVRVHAQGLAYPESQDTQSLPAPVAIERLPAYTMGGRVDSRTIYGWFRDLGFDYGPTHQCLGELFYHEDEVLARLTAPLGDPEGQGFTLHPGLLDGALQASIGFSVPALERGGGEAAEPLVPFGLERLRNYRGMFVTRDVRWVHLRRRSGGGANPVTKLDVDLLDADGAICLRLEGYSARQGRPAAPVRAPELTALPQLHLRQAKGGDRLHSCHLDPKDIYLRDHRVDGRFLLPAVALIDLARRVADTLPAKPGAPALRIRRATWQKPLFVEEPGREVTVRVSERGAGWSMALESDDMSYAQCELAWTGAAPPMLVGGDDATRLTLACEEVSSVRAFRLLFRIVNLCGEATAARAMAIPHTMEDCVLHRDVPERVNVEIVPLHASRDSKYRQYDIRIVDMAGVLVMHVTKLAMLVLEPRARVEESGVHALRAKVRELIGQLQKIPPDSIGLDDDLTSFGLDSISFTELSNRVNRAFGTNTMPTVFFEHGNVRALVDALLQLEPSLGAEAAHPAPEARALQPVLEAPAPQPAQTQGAVAIIGMAGRFPGADNLEDFWKNLVDNRDCVAETPPVRRGWQPPHGGFLSDVAGFDAAFFGVQDSEARRMDPQARVSLETAWHVLEDAGLPANQVRGSDTAVYMGVSAMDYRELRLQQAQEQGRDSAAEVESFPFMIPNRISYAFDFRGPSQAIDTACSSSLIALHRGVESLRQGHCQLAMVGGVNIIARAGGASFEARADGYHRGEGVGMVLLERLEDAQRHGHRIHAVILGTGENHGGHSLSPASPNAEAHRALLTQVHRQARIEPSQIGYIEAHGIGTAVGDAVECEALRQAFAGASHCAVGSVKDHIGHLEAAGGIAGVIKVVLMLRNRKIPGSPASRAANPYVNWADGPLSLVRATQNWSATLDAQGRELPLHAGVNSFGRGGTNAHVLLQEYVPPSDEAAAPFQPTRHAFVLSAKSHEALLAQARALASTLEHAGENHDSWLRSMAHTLQVGREALAWRFGVMAESISELHQQLQLFTHVTNGAEEAGDAPANFGVAKIAQSNRYFTEDEDTQLLAREWLAKGKLDKVLKLWLDGVPIDWSLLYPKPPAAPGAFPLRLPAYPFSKTPFWLDDGDGSPANDPVDGVFERKPMDGALNERLQERPRTLGPGRMQPRNESKAPDSFINGVGARPADDFTSYYRMAFGPIETFKCEVVELSPGVSLEVLHNIDARKPTLVFLPPMACLATVWLHQVRYFSEHYSVVICHYPGHARSTGLEAIAGSEDGMQGVARLIWSLLDRYQVGSPVHVVGWSLGGLIAQCMAVERPEGLASLALVNSVMASGEENPEGIRKALHELVKEISTTLAPVVEEHFNKDYKAIKACYDTAVLGAYTRGMKRCLGATKLAQLSIPALVLAGAEDRVIRPDFSRSLHAQLRQSSFQQLERAGHFLPMTHAEWFNEQLQQHLASSARKA